MALTSPKFVLDTNVALYYLGNRLAQPLPSGIYFVSVMTEMELLSYPGLSEAETVEISNFLSRLTLVMLEEGIKNLAIQLRREHRLKLPDSIIAATALDLDATLLTNDRQMAKLQGLKTQSLELA